MSIHVQIRRNSGSRDFLPSYSTIQMLQGVCHLAYVPKDELIRLTRVEQQRESREKFEENKERIYMALASGRGVKFVANQFRIGYEALLRYLDEEEIK